MAESRLGSGRGLGSWLRRIATRGTGTFRSIRFVTRRKINKSRLSANTTTSTLAKQRRRPHYASLRVRALAMLPRLDLISPLALSHCASARRRPSTVPQPTQKKIDACVVLWPQLRSSK